MFVRRILDEKRRATACFARIAYPYPTPPPATNVTSTLAAESLRRQRERLGDLEVYPEPRKTDEALWEFDTQQAMERTQAMIDSLGEAQPILRTMLENAKQEIQESNVDPANTDNTYYGRRLMQRVEYNTRVTDVLITHEIMQFYGKGGIPVPATPSPTSFPTPTPSSTSTPTLAPTRASLLARARCDSPSTSTHCPTPLPHPRTRDAGAVRRHQV